MFTKNKKLNIVTKLLLFEMILLLTIGYNLSIITSIKVNAINYKLFNSINIGKSSKDVLSYTVPTSDEILKKRINIDNFSTIDETPEILNNNDNSIITSSKSITSNNGLSMDEILKKRNDIKDNSSKGYKINMARDTGTLIVQNYISYNLSIVDGKPIACITYAKEDFISGDVVIPKAITYNGVSYPVREIWEYAFSTCSNITSIYIPNSVYSIGEAAFADCTNLKLISFSNYLDNIGDYAFQNCLKLESIPLIYTIDTIGKSAFSNCTSLKSVDLYLVSDSLGDYAFEGCTRLESAHINSSYIGYGAFKDCSSLVSVDMYSRVKSIGDYAFTNCNSLQSVNMDNCSSLKSIGTGAFSNCTSLTSIDMPDSITTVGDVLFLYSKNLFSVHISTSLTSMGYAMFSGCTSLTSVNIPSSVISISSYAFYNCTSLISINIPSSVISIGDNSFYGCTSLTIIDIPNSVTSIGDNAFRKNTSLKTVYIRNKNTAISSSAFGKSISSQGYINDNNVTTYGLGEKIYVLYKFINEDNMYERYANVKNRTFEDYHISSVKFGNEDYRMDFGGPDITFSNVDANWTNKSVSALVSVYDAESGVKRVKLPDGNYTTSVNFTYTFTSNGYYTFEGEDNVGNITTINNSIYISTIDNIAPTATITQTPTTPTNGNVNISVSASDSQSGVQSITKPDGTVVFGNTTTYTATSNGNYDFIIADNVGNKATKSITINNIDKIAPSLTLSQNISSFTNKDIVISANASDDQSGVKSITKPDGTVINGNATNYTAISNGVYSFVVEDNAGNVTNKSITILNIDKTSPVLTLTQNNTNWSNGSITINIKATDDVSGVKQIILPNGNVVSNATTTYEVSDVGVYYFKAIDNVGNTAINYIVISNIDKNKPTITITNNKNWSNASSENVIITATDN